jgi:hypothetical protein
LDPTDELKLSISSTSKASEESVQELALAENRLTDKNPRRNDTSNIPNSELGHDADFDGLEARESRLMT